MSRARGALGWTAWVALGGCAGSASSAGSPPVQSAPREVLVAPAMDASRPLAQDASQDAARDAGTAEERFRQLALSLAGRAHLGVAGWGTVQLDERGGTQRFAVLVPSEVGERGAYLLEEEQGARWVLSFTYDGRTSAAGLSEQQDGREPPWRALGLRVLEHSQSHHAGYERLELALRGGIPVLLRWEYLGDQRSGRPARVRAFAQGGVCRTPCPSLLTLDADGGVETDSALRARGPLRTVEELLGAL